MMTPTRATGRYHVNSILKPVRLRPSGLFLFAKLARPFGIDSLTIWLLILPAQSKAKRRQAGPIVFIINMATSLTAPLYVYMYTHVDTNEWLSDVSNFKKQGNYTEQNK